MIGMESKMARHSWRMAVLSLLSLLFWSVGAVERGPSNGVLELWSDDFDAAGGLDAVEVDPAFAGVSHFSHAFWTLESLDVGLENGPSFAATMIVSPTLSSPR